MPGQLFGIFAFIGLVLIAIAILLLMYAELVDYLRNKKGE